MQKEIIGQWEELMSRPELRGHRVKVTIMDEPSAPAAADDWLDSLRRMADNGVRTTRPADDSRESIYEETR